MKKRFSTHGFELISNNLRQVRIPVGAKALPNSAGIAPGFVVRIGGAEAFFLPGVPREMERMFIDQVAPRLAVRMAEAGVPRAAVRPWHVYGRGESHLDHRLAGLLNGLEGATLHFRTSHPVNHVKVVVRGKSVEEEQATLERIDAELGKRIGPGIYAVDNDTFPAAVAKALRAQDPPATLAIAESCTGGLAGELVTSESGASNFFRGSIVAYTNEMKTSVLGVKPETLADFGAVSEPTAREMAEGAKRVCGSSVAVAITGVAGPGGGTPDKPVGTVCFAVCGPGTTRTSTKLFAGNRERVRVAAAYYALDLRAPVLRTRASDDGAVDTSAQQLRSKLRGGPAAGRPADGDRRRGRGARAGPARRQVVEEAREPARHDEVPRGPSRSSASKRWARWRCARHSLARRGAAARSPDAERFGACLLARARPT